MINQPTSTEETQLADAINATATMPAESIPPTFTDPISPPASTTSTAPYVEPSANHYPLLSGRAAISFPPPGSVIDPAIEGSQEKFPLDAFPPLFIKTASNMAQVYQTPVSVVAMSALGVTSGAVGKWVVVKGAFKDKVTALNMYIMIVADTGTCKDLIGETLCASFLSRSKELTDNHRLETNRERGTMGYIKNRIQILQQRLKAFTSANSETRSITQALMESEDALGDLKAKAARKVTLLTNNTTSEAMARDLADNSEALFSFSAEAGGALEMVFGKHSKKGNADIDLLLAAYSGTSVTIRRIREHGDLVLQRPRLALLWLMQSCIARKLFQNQELIARGLLPRILLIDSGARRQIDDRQIHQLLYCEDFNRFIEGILDRRLDGSPRTVLTCTPEAREVFASFDEEGIHLEHGQFADCVGLMSRVRESAIKVAGLFAVAENATEISAELAARAVRVVRWAMYNGLALLQLGRQERMRAEFNRLEHILRASGGEITVGFLASSHGINRDRLDAILAAFPGRVASQRRPHAGAGRPTEVVMLISEPSSTTSPSINQ